jgi:hypothetical protein
MFGVLMSLPKHPAVFRLHPRAAIHHWGPSYAGASGREAGGAAPARRRRRGHRAVLHPDHPLTVECTMSTLRRHVRYAAIGAGLGIPSGALIFIG